MKIPISYGFLRAFPPSKAPLQDNAKSSQQLTISPCVSRGKPDFPPCEHPFWALIYSVGSVKKNRLPIPSSLSTRIRPRCDSTICFTIASPNPVPPDSRLRALSTR